MDTHAVDRNELHDHRRIGGVVGQLQIVRKAAGRIGQPPYLAVCARHLHGRKLLTADREIPFSTGIVVAIRGIIGPWARALAYFGGIRRKLRAEVRILLVQHLTIRDIRRAVHKLEFFLSSEYLDVLERHMKDIGLGKRRIISVDMGEIAYLADSDNARHAARYLVECKAVDMRVEPEQARRMVRRNTDTIDDDVHLDRTVLMCRLWNRRAIGGIEILHKDVVAEGWIVKRRRARLNQKTVGVHVGRI